MKKIEARNFIPSGQKILTIIGHSGVAGVGRREIALSIKFPRNLSLGLKTNIWQNEKINFSIYSSKALSSLKLI